MVKRHLASLAISRAGFPVSDFAEQKLGISYQLFMYRLRNNCLRLSDYHVILQATGCKFEDLWPIDTTTTHQQPPRKPLEIRDSPPKVRDSGPSVSAPAPSSFVLEDVYEGGLPE